MTKLSQFMRQMFTPSLLLYSRLRYQKVERKLQNYEYIKNTRGNASNWKNSNFGVRQMLKRRRDWSRTKVFAVELGDKCKSRVKRPSTRIDPKKNITCQGMGSQYPKKSECEMEIISVDIDAQLPQTFLQSQTNESTFSLFAERIFRHLLVHVFPVLRVAKIVISRRFLTRYFFYEICT